MFYKIRNITIRVAGVGRSRVFGWSRDLFLVLLPTQLLIYCKKWKRDSNIKPTETVKEERVLSSNNSYSVFLLLCRNWSIITVLICTFNMYSSCLKKCFFWGGNYECVNTSVGFISLGIHFLSRFVNWWIFQSWLKLLVVLICIYISWTNTVHFLCTVFVIHIWTERIKFFDPPGGWVSDKKSFVFLPECFF